MAVIICSIVKNEAENFLPRALDCWKSVSDRLVVVDNYSTDGTRRLLEDANAEIHCLKTPMDGAETNARSFLWDRATKSAEDGDWLVWADADHCFAGDFRPTLAQTDRNRAVFPVFDMWTPTAYRSDAWWRLRPWWQAVRWGPWAHKATWDWPERGWHSGHVPRNAAAVFGLAVPVPNECGLLHYGYATPELRVRHAEAYQARSEHLTPGEKFHAGTITDERPRLVALPFEPRWRLLG